MILAIDPSLSNTAAFIGDEPANYRHKCFGTKPAGQKVHERIPRFESQVGTLIEWVETESTGCGVDAVFIEGYSFMSNNAHDESLHEYGGILRWHLLDLTKRIYEVAPSTLKKFCTGKGNSKKDMVCAALAHRYRVMFNSNDEYDAYGLYRLGLIAEGLDATPNQQQREAVDTVLGKPKPAKKKKVLPVSSSMF